MMIAINLNNTNTNFIYLQDWVTKLSLVNL